MHKIFSAFLGLFLLSIVTVSHAAEDDKSIVPAYIMKSVPGAEIVGRAHLKVFIWEVYNAALYAPEGQWNANAPYALRLEYLRNLKGADIADRSAAEIVQQGKIDSRLLQDWHDQMLTIFPDVKKGTALTGVYLSDGQTAFFKDGQEIGRVTDKEFGPRFFDIWLSPKTSEPVLRKQLLALNR